MTDAARLPHPNEVPDVHRRRGQDLLLFLHIPKTAGMNLQHAINRQYGLDRVLVPPHVDWSDPPVYRRYLEGAELPGKDAPGFDPNAPAASRLAELGTESLDQLAVVMGHFWYGLHATLERPARYVTILRDPIDRVVSAFYFYGRRFGVRLPLDEYVRSGRDYEIDNAQTRRIHGRLPDADIRFVECTHEMLETAKRNLRERFAVVGISERFDETFLLIARTFGWQYPTYDVYNVSRSRPRGAEIPEGVRRRLVERNRYDYELYGYARKLFEEQLERARVDAAAMRRFRRINFFYRLPKEHPLIGPPAVAGVRVVGKALKPLRRTRR